eukprot:CAMPEP_0206510460 /NCGR_PEP_ID=MMETSP0324_2-20121206/59667_1 /ASSEMBLY_ACC=CAM_ASM_000836 /TAXON_ID=2866 /ORGANISM="Crypthecodinium cohnii, Strain Seligo" /LENGTH=66 /DNA_ID=CAMNT_0054001971 /DNA_START=35 /DNA_END=232 /DNA_ORIENTATION=+
MSLRKRPTNVWVLALACLAWIASGSVTESSTKWVTPSMRPAAFGEFPTKTTQKVIHVGYPKTGTVS